MVAGCEAPGPGVDGGWIRCISASGWGSGEGGVGEGVKRLKVREAILCTVYELLNDG